MNELTPPHALILSGGWPGHQPHVFAAIISDMLEHAGFSVTRADTLDVLEDAERLTQYTLIVPNWTMGRIGETQSKHLRRAVQSGVGLGGFHGGMGDAFRDDPAYQFMVGGQFVAHPGGIRDYRVDITTQDHPITRGASGFDVRSEQYYMHVDPSNTVLATTTFDGQDTPWTAGVVMPVAWTRMHGQGRVFYSSVGHDPAEFNDPAVASLHLRGLLWAAGRLT